MSKELFFRMMEEDYLKIPEPIRMEYLASKIYAESDSDLDFLMQDETFKRLKKEYVNAKKSLEEHKFNLRNKSRKVRPA